MKKYMDIQVHVDKDYVYMSKRDWQRIVEVLKKATRADFELIKKEEAMTISGAKMLH